MRILDILFSGLAIVILLPIMLPIMLLLKLTGEHDIFYAQSRIGRKGMEFPLLKFATMLRNSPNLPGGLYTEVNDPRMLPLGHFLRKTKINELPQLLNIFVGQMSVVGYRPTVPQHFNNYPEDAKVVLSGCRPGLTGIGSVFFRNEEEILQQVEDKAFFHRNVINPYKAALECWYANHANVGTYLLLIFVTTIVVIQPKATYWRSWFHGLPSVPSELVEYIGSDKLVANIKE